MIKKFKTMFLNKDFIIFLCIGVFNTLSSAFFASVWSFIIPNVNISFILGYILSLCIAYMLNSFIIFKQKLSLNKLLKFAISYIPNFIIQNIVVIIFHNILSFDKLIAFAIAAIIGVPITFIILKIFAFKNVKK